MRHVVTILIAILALLPVGTHAQIRTPINDNDLVERTVIEISRLQQRGNGHELYDWLSTLSRDQIPRIAFVDWLEQDTRFVPVSDPEILDISFGDFTWPVTGTTYPNVATIEIEQEGTSLGFQISQRSTIHLLNEGTHWRWLFGESQVEISAIASRMTSEQSFASTYDDEPYQTIDSFWAGVFADLDLEYQSVTNVVAINTTTFETGCGIEEDIDSAGIYLCLRDATIYYSPALRTSILAEFGETGWQTIIAHEWAHRVQLQIGILLAEDPELESGAYILELETQADCMAGIYFQAELGFQSITRQDTQVARSVLAAYGDFRIVSWDSPIAHGSSEQRVESFNLGFRQGFVGCGLDLDTWSVIT